ncbi:MAG: tetratricopeptide repeat protein [Bdellovibrionales bacterium]|nr:tetratricopeptide repeat protein [Bdellovibrionales bacterium]
MYPPTLELSRQAGLRAIALTLLIPALSAWAGPGSLDSSGELPSGIWREREATEEEPTEPETLSEAEEEGEVPEAEEERQWPTPLPQRASVGKLEEAKALLRERKWADAAVALKGLLQERPGSVRVALDLSRALIQLGQREEAMLALAPLAQQYKGSNRRLLARRLSVLSQAFRTNETYQLYQEGMNLLLLGKAADASARFARVLKKEPGHVRTLLRDAQALHERGNFAGALERLQAAHRLNPLEPEVRVWLGRLMVLQGQGNDGLTLLSEAVASPSAPSELGARWYAEALLANRRRDEAMEVLSADVRKHPDHLANLALLAELRAGGSSVSRASLWESRRDLQVALSRFPAYGRPRATASGSEPEWLPWSAERVRKDIDELLGRIEGKLSGTLGAGG